MKPFVDVSPFAYQYGGIAISRFGRRPRSSCQIRRCLASFWRGPSEPIAVPSELVAAVTARGIQYCRLEDYYDELKKKFDECQTQWLASSEEQSEQIDRLRGRNDELQTQLAAAALAPHDRPEKSLTTRERDSLFKLVIGMAVGGYSYDATAFRSKHPAEIANDLAIAGCRSMSTRSASG